MPDMFCLISDTVSFLYPLSGLTFYPILHYPTVSINKYFL